MSVSSDGEPASVSVSSTGETVSVTSPPPSPSPAPAPAPAAIVNEARNVPRKWRKSMVYVVIRRATNTYNTCTGTVLDKRHILTAASCFSANGAKDAIPRRSFAIIGASTTEMYLDTERNDKIFMASVFVHRNFKQNSIASRNDIAIARLKTSIKDRHYKPVTLVNAPNSTPSQAYVAGYDLYEQDSAALRTPKYAAMQYQSESRCNRRIGTNFINADRVCTTSASREYSSCFAEAGAPIFVETQRSIAQFGIVSGWHGDCETRKSVTHGAKIQAYKGAIDSLVLQNDQSSWTKI